MNGKVVCFGVLALVVLGLIYVQNGGSLARDRFAILQAYGGMNAEFTDVSGPYTMMETKQVTPASAIYDPVGDWNDPIGMKAELQSAINIITTTQIDEVSKSVVDEVAKTNTTTKVKVNDVECDLGLTIRQTGPDTFPVWDIVFTIQVSENTMNVFPGANDSIAYILLIETQEPADAEGLMDVTPASGGYVFPLTTVKSVPVPSWITDSGYSGLLSDLKVVTFQVEVQRAEWTPLVAPKATFDIHVHVLQFGCWVRVKPYTPWKEPPTIDPLQWLKDLFAAIGHLVVIIIAAILTVLIFVKVKKPQFAVVGVIILWVVIAYFLGWLDPYLGGLGG